MSDSNDIVAHPDQLTMEQMEGIQADIAKQPMVGSGVPVITLAEFYREAHLPGFIPGIEFLNNKFSYMRQIRGDGNCFYRSFWFGYLEKLLQHLLASDESQRRMAESEIIRIRAKIQGSLSELVALGYPEFALESFHEELLEIIDALPSLSLQSLEEMFQEGGKADYLTWFMRVLTAGHLKQYSERFMPFVEGLYVDMDAYCKAEVEPMNKECEQIQILALCEYLEIQVEISYLDGRFDITEGVRTVRIPEDGAHWVVHLLYRPGHYDLLYPL